MLAACDGDGDEDDEKRYDTMEWNEWQLTVVDTVFDVSHCLLWIEDMSETINRIDKMKWEWWTLNRQSIKW